MDKINFCRETSTFLKITQIRHFLQIRSGAYVCIFQLTTALLPTYVIIISQTSTRKSYDYYPYIPCSHYSQSAHYQIFG